MELDLEIINEVDVDVEGFESLFEEIAQYTLEIQQIKEDVELSVSIIDNEKIHMINRDYRHVDRATDVITFALEDEESPYIEGMPRALGDIFISYDKVIEQAKSYGHSEKRELCFLFVHGLLHLLGYDHMCEEDEKVMIAMQNRILEHFSILRK